MKEINETGIADVSFFENKVQNGWFDQSLKNWQINAGEVTIQQKNNTNYLMIDSKNSCQVKQRMYLAKGHTYYLSCEVRVTHYAQGTFGVQVYGNLESGRSKQLGKRQQNIGFEKISGTFTAVAASNTFLYVGSMGAASGSGQVGKVMLLDLTEIFGLGNEPTARVLEEVLVTEKARGVYLRLHGRSVEPSDQTCEQQFLAAMNDKGHQLSMTKTVFKNPHGLVADGQVSTSRDMLLLALQAAGTEILLKVWGAKNYTVSIEGPHARELKIRSLVASPLIEEEYTFLGGKTGTVNAKKTNVMLLLADKKSNIFLTTVMGATSNENRFIDARKLVKIAQKRLSNPNYQPDEKLSAVSGSVLAVNGHPLFWTNALPPSIYEINENEQLAPVSLNKVMSALLLLEHVANLHETFTFKESDITRGSGPQMYAGDTISFLDALYLMMLPSSNSTAMAVGRVVGRRMIAMREV